MKRERTDAPAALAGASVVLVCYEATASGAACVVSEITP